MATEPIKSSGLGLVPIVVAWQAAVDAVPRRVDRILELFHLTPNGLFLG